MRTKQYLFFKTFQFAICLFMTLLFIFLLLFYKFYIVNLLDMAVGTLIGILGWFRIRLMRTSKLADFKYPHPIRYFAQFFTQYLIGENWLPIIGGIFLLYGVMGEILRYVFE